MNFLFVHNNFPAQFRHIALALARDPSANVAAIGSRTAHAMRGVQLLKYSLPDGDVRATHPFARRFDLECRRAEQVLYALNVAASGRFHSRCYRGSRRLGRELAGTDDFPQSSPYCVLRVLLRDRQPRRCVRS